MAKSLQGSKASLKIHKTKFKRRMKDYNFIDPQQYYTLLGLLEDFAKHVVNLEKRVDELQKLLDERENTNGNKGN